MGKILYTDFEGVNDIIGTMMDNPQLKKALTRTNLYKFWDSILPEKFCGYINYIPIYNTFIVV